MADERQESPAPLFDRTNDGRSFVPTSFRRAAARSGSPGRPSGRRASALPWAAGSTVARWPLIGTSVLWLAVLPSAEAAAQAAPPHSEVGGAIAEAAQRFGLPEAWIRAVMRVESAFQPRAVSHAGAMGLMQVMPQTYAELRGRYGLGADPFHPRDNILAGAAYLREMYDRFGARGFLAAYNAGPARYQQHLIEGRPLPLETRAYVAKLTPAVGAAGVSPAPAAVVAPPAVARPTLFVVIGGGPGREAGASPDETPAVLAPARSPLFAALTPRAEAR
jgi:soluble lytic murein transglycosylase-like protein